MGRLDLEKMTTQEIHELVACVDDGNLSEISDFSDDIDDDELFRLCDKVCATDKAQNVIPPVKFIQSNPFRPSLK